MNSNYINSTKQGIQHPFSDFEIFFWYNRNKLLLQNTIVGDVALSEDSFKKVDNNSFSSSASLLQSSWDHKRELYKSYVQGFLNEIPGHYSQSVNFMHFREHISHKWKLADESTKSVFRQLARERRDRENDV